MPKKSDRLSLVQYEHELRESGLCDCLSINEVIEEFCVDWSSTVIRAIETNRLVARKMDGLPGEKSGRYLIWRKSAEMLWKYRKAGNDEQLRI